VLIAGVPIEILGWTLSIADLAGVGAVIVAPLVFWIGYRRTTRTEEIKTVNDLMERMNKAYGTRYLFRIKEPYPKDSREGQIQWFNEHLRYLIVLQMNIL
jgi:hypothetical protein